MKHFKNPVSMRVPSQEAFERDLRKSLEELGAEFCCIACFTSYPFLASNSSGESGIIENFLECDKLNFNRHFIETYDPEQFLAICKLEIEMIVGECYTVVHNDGGFMIGYLLENNVKNEKEGLFGFFEGIDDLDEFCEKDEWCYSYTDRIIRLSTPEEKAKLDAVIAEHEKPVNENNSFCDKTINEENIINTFKKAINQIEVKDEIIVTDSELKPNPIKLHDKLNLFRESIKKHLDSYNETKLKIEKQIKDHEEEIKKLYSALKVLEALK